MKNPALILWSRLIQAAAIVILGLSALLLLAPSLGEAFFHIVYFHQPDSPVPVSTETRGYMRFANGIIGAVMAGWMMTIILLARGPFLFGDKWAWQAIAWPLLAWFGVDTAFSIAHGVWGNVMLNMGTALMFGIPLIGARQHFIRQISG